MEQLQPGLRDFSRPSASPGRSRSWIFVLLLMGAAGTLAACGGSGGSVSATHNSTTEHSPSTPPTSSASSAAVLMAYRSSWSAFEHAAAAANPEDPALAATMTGSQLTGVRANFLADQRQGIVGKGSFTLHPKVTELTSSSAHVVDCAYSTAELYYRATGKPVPPITPPENDGVDSTLVESGGVWKVSSQTVTDGKCSSAS
jgi:hypothetical protein